MAGFRGKPSRYIRLKGKTYQFKIGIPADCRAYFKGQQNYVESTGTGDVVTARKWRDRKEREMQDMFKDIRSGRLVPSDTVVVDQIATALEHGRASREAYVNEEDPDQKALILDIAQEHSERLERMPELQAAFDNAWAGHEQVDAHVDAWLKEANLATKTTMDYRGIVNRLTAWCKVKGHTVAHIDRKTAGQYVSGELLDPEKMTRVTAKKHLTAISGYWDHLRRRGHLQKSSINPWSEQIAPERGKQGVATEEERAFEDDELVKVLYLDPPVNRGGRPKWEKELKELALISTLSGMRLAEITDLTVECCEDGRFDLTKAKTNAGVRVIPIHSKLVDLIAKLCEGRSPKDLLFEEFDASKAFARRRVKLGVNEKRDGKRRSLVNFHSFRRTFATKAAHANIPDATIQDVIGHEREDQKKKSVLRQSYVKGGSWKQKVDCVEAVTIPASPSPSSDHASAQ